MAKDETVVKFDTVTVGDLLDKLAGLAKDPELCAVLDATIDGPGGETFTGFRIIRRVLTDKSEVLDLELIEG